MTRASFRAALAAAALALAAAPAASALGAQQRVDERSPIAATAVIRLTLVTSSGSVRVIGWDRDSLAITGSVPAGNRFEAAYGAGFRAAKLFVDADREPALGGKPPAPGKPLALEVRVPKGCRLWIKGGGVDIDVTGITGGLDLNVVSGQIRVVGSPRELNAEAMDGRIDIDGAVAWVRAKTAGGPITLRGNGEDVALTSVSGDVTASGTYARGRFETVTGGIRFDGGVEPAGALSFDSHSGAVELRVPRMLGADYDVSTISGTIVNELTAARPVAARDMRARELGFTTGSGGAHVAIRTFKGTVVLRPR